MDDDKIKRNFAIFLLCALFLLGIIMGLVEDSQNEEDNEMKLEFCKSNGYNQFHKESFKEEYCMNSADDIVYINTLPKYWNLSTRLHNG